MAAFAVNLAIAASKFVAFAFTGSGAMLAEGVHSIADSGNQLLLMIGSRRASRAATPEHQFGYGGYRYIYSFMVAVVLFSLGGLFAIFEGVSKLRRPHEISSPEWALTILAVAILLEAFSFHTAIKSARPLKADRTWWAYIRESKAPELPVVLLEDFGALAGLVIAGLAVTASLVFDAPVFDALGTFAIGLLLLCVAVILAIESKSLLLGESATPAEAEKIRSALLASDEISGVIHLRTLHLGPEELLVAAKIAVQHDSTALSIARAIDAAELRIRSVVPEAALIYLEPDIERSAGPR